MNKVKTDNSYLFEKINLRITNLPKKKEIKVLDCFHGKGKLWEIIKNKSDKKIEITGIEKNKEKISKKIFIINGNTLKILRNINLFIYDIIDLDCYGSPSKYLNELFKNKTLNEKHIIFYTNIYTMFGGQTKEILKNSNITMKMYRKCPTIFNKKRLEFFYNLLYNNNIRRIKEININNHKFYGMFKINPV